MGILPIHADEERDIRAVINVEREDDDDATGTPSEDMETKRAATVEEEMGVSVDMGEEDLIADLAVDTGDKEAEMENPKAALSSTSNVSKNFRNLKLDWRSCQLHAGGVGSKEVVGGLVFSCWGRGESFFGHSNVDSSPFLDNFPGIPMAGIFCYGEVGRGFTLLNADDHEDHEEQTSCCCLHVYSTIYVLVSYTPAPLKH
uniref:F-box/LRR-repeat protein n=1 Tax=Populus alba TaxID=43335 RepID=A0A4U5Q5G7_POPAL|nr:F-box/LRR-repeat protein [Populus alba]